MSPVKLPHEAFDSIPRDGVAHLFADRNTDAAAVSFVTLDESDKVMAVYSFSIPGQMPERPAFQKSVSLGKPLPV